MLKKMSDEGWQAQKDEVGMAYSKVSELTTLLAQTRAERDEWRKEADLLRGRLKEALVELSKVRLTE